MKMALETKLIHAGQKPDKQTGAVSVPVYQTSTFKQDGIGKTRGWEYSRSSNPTRKALEDCLAELENGKYAYAFSSGMAAEAAVANLLKPKDIIIAGKEIYGGTYRLLEKHLKRNGIGVMYHNMSDIEGLKKKINKKVKMLWFETPSNPLLSVCDIRKIADICVKKKIISVADNTFASPYWQNPISMGIDIVTHSCTKYLSGHSDVLGGAVITSSEELAKMLKFQQNALGAILGPWDSWLVLRGIKTLAVRMKAHQENAFAVAEFLKKEKKVLKVFFPGLKEHKDYELANSQMRGFPGVVSFEIEGARPAVEIFVKKLEIFSLADSLGGVESLACYPPVQTHASLSEKERFEAGIRPGLIRLSVGIENKKDLLEDLRGAFNFSLAKSR